MNDPNPDLTIINVCSELMSIPVATLVALKEGTHVVVPKISTERQKKAAEQTVGAFELSAGPKMYAAMIDAA